MMWSYPNSTVTNFCSLNPEICLCQQYVSAMLYYVNSLLGMGLMTRQLCTLCYQTSQGQAYDNFSDFKLNFKLGSVQNCAFILILEVIYFDFYDSHCAWPTEIYTDCCGDRYD